MSSVTLHPDIQEMVDQKEAYANRRPYYNDMPITTRALVDIDPNVRLGAAYTMLDLVAFKHRDGIQYIEALENWLNFEPIPEVKKTMIEIIKEIKISHEVNNE